MIKLTHVDGNDKDKIVLYALSTCAWCKKTKKILNELKVAYDYVYVDELDKKDSDEADKIVNKWNSKGTYPTIIIDNKRSINGYNEKEVKKLGG